MVLRLIVFLLGLAIAAVGLVAFRDPALLGPTVSNWLASLVGPKLVGPVPIFIGILLMALAMFFTGLFKENPSTKP
jgi:hypothetical protein